MAYRKTENVLATFERNRASVIKASIKHLSSRKGVDGFGTTSVAKIAKLSVGVVYSFFADKEELMAAAAAQCMREDVDALREDIRSTSPTTKLTHGILLLIERLDAKPRLTQWLSTRPDYHEGLREELTKLFDAAGAEHPRLTADIAYGAISSAAGRMDARDVQPLTQALLRAAGIRAKVPA